MICLLSLAVAADLQVPIVANHDLFVTRDATAPYIRLAETWPSPDGISLAFSPDAAPDTLLLRSRDTPSAPRDAEIPVGATGRTLYILSAAQGGLEVRDVVADGTIAYTNGQTQPLKWLSGEQAWPAWAGATGRGADAWAIGRNVGGDVVTASLLTVELAYPDVPVASVVVRSRGGSLSWGILAITLSEDPPRTASLAADRQEIPHYDFRVPNTLSAPLPMDAALLIRGPAERPVVARDGHLFYGEHPSERARFWGINLIDEGAIPEKAVATDEAQGLARAGYNLVRLHHLDGDGPVSLANPNRGQPGEAATVPEMLDRLDHFVAELKKAGVYLYLEGLTKRSFKAGEGVTAPEGVPVGNKYVGAFWPDWLAAEKAWIAAVWDRTNPYTGVRYADEPAVAMFELLNENSLVVAWSNGALERLPGMHRRRLDDLWNAWLRQKYGTDARLEKAWAGSPRGGIQLGESLDVASVAREPVQRSRSDLFPTARAADLVTFYAELEAAHQGELARFLKEELHFRAPLVCNTSFSVPAADALLSACDVVDFHFYWDAIAETTVFNNTSIVRSPGRAMERFSSCQEGFPCTLSELNHSWPNRYGVEAPLFWAAMAARQDLDAVIWFGLRHGPWRAETDGPDGALDIDGRYNAMVQMPTASAMFRSGEVAPAEGKYVRWWSPDGILRDLAEQPGLWHEALVGWAGAIDSRLRSAFGGRPPPGIPGRPVEKVGTVPAEGRSARTSEREEPAGPVSWSPPDGWFRVDTPLFQVVIGGGETSGMRVAVESFAAVSLASLDGEPVASGRALLTVVGRSERRGTLWSVGSPGLIALGQGPAWLEAVTGAITVWRDTRPTVYALGTRGERGAKVKVKRTQDGWVLVVGALPTPWFEWVSAG